MEETKEECHENNTSLFRMAVSNSFKKIAMSVSEEEFIGALTVIDSSQASLARRLHKAMMKELSDSMNKDLDDILEDGSFQEALEKVSDLLEKTDIPEYEQAWRPPGDVDLHLRSLDASKIIAESDLLQTEVEGLEAENTKLMEEVSAVRSRISNLHENIALAVTRSPAAVNQLENRIQQLERVLKVLDDE